MTRLRYCGLTSFASFRATASTCWQMESTFGNSIVPSCWSFFICSLLFFQAFQVQVCQSGWRKFLITFLEGGTCWKPASLLALLQCIAMYKCAQQILIGDKFFPHVGHLKDLAQVVKVVREGNTLRTEHSCCSHQKRSEQYAGKE